MQQMELPFAMVHLPYVTSENEAMLNREYGRSKFLASLYTEEWYVQQPDRLQGYEEAEDIYSFTGRTQIDLSKIAVEGLLYGVRACQALPDEQCISVLLLENAALRITDKQMFFPSFTRWPLVRNNQLVAVRLDSINGEVNLRQPQR